MPNARGTVIAGVVVTEAGGIHPMDDATAPKEGLCVVENGTRVEVVPVGKIEAVATRGAFVPKAVLGIVDATAGVKPLETAEAFAPALEAAALAEAAALEAAAAAAAFFTTISEICCFFHSFSIIFFLRVFSRSISILSCCTTIRSLKSALSLVFSSGV